MTTAYYKITDPQIVAQIKEWGKSRNKIVKQISDFAHSLGFESCRIHDSRRFGIHLHCFCEPTDSVDLSNYKLISKEDKTYLPKKSNKAFYRTIAEQFEYLSGVKTAPFNYHDFAKWTLRDDSPYAKSPAQRISWTDDTVIFDSKEELDPSELQAHVQKIKGSEYHLILESITELADKESEPN